MQKSYLNTAIHYGAYYGLSAFIFSALLSYTLGNPLGLVSWLGVWIPVLFICLAMKHQRDNVSEGYIDYWEAFRTGLSTIFFGGILFGMLLYLFGTVVQPNLLADYKTDMLNETENMRNLKFFNEALVDSIVDGIEKTTLGSAITGDYFNKTLGAALVSLVAAAIYKRNKNINTTHDL